MEKQSKVDFAAFVIAQLQFSCFMRILSHPYFQIHYRQIIRFVICGLLGAVMDFSVLYILTDWYSISPIIAYIFSSGIPSIFVFLFNKYITFGASDGNSNTQSKRFIIVYTLTFILNYLLSSLFYFLGLAYLVSLHVGSYSITEVEVTYLARVIAIAITAVINYLSSHHFIFKAEH